MNKIERVLFEEQFKTLEVKGFFTTIYRYIVDSKFRKSKHLNLFLKEQLSNTPFELRVLAKSLKTGHMDDTMVNILRWVHKNIKYTSDKEQYNKTEYWAKAIETYTNRRGDCDDMNSLIYVLARLAGIGYSLLWNAIGYVKVENQKVGHYWLLYHSLRENKVVSIDSTYHYNGWSIKNRPRFNLNPYKYQTIWYLFNEKHVKGVRMI